MSATRATHRHLAVAATAALAAATLATAAFAVSRLGPSSTVAGAGTVATAGGRPSDHAGATGASPTTSAAGSREATRSRRHALGTAGGAIAGGGGGPVSGQPTRTAPTGPPIAHLPVAGGAAHGGSSTGPFVVTDTAGLPSAAAGAVRATRATWATSTQAGSSAPVASAPIDTTGSSGSSLGNASVSSVILGRLGSIIAEQNPVRGSAGFAQAYLPNPAEIDVQAAADAVTVSWADGAAGSDTDETGFIVYKRDNTGAWQPAYRVNATHNPSDNNYSWVDTAKDVSGQCYLVASVGAYNFGYSEEECTVRPDPSEFPQSPPSTVEQWAGLSNVNDGTGPLENTQQDESVDYEDRTFGVSLGWEDTAENNVKLQRPGSNTEPLMYGEAVAVRVWGGGWLTYGHQTFGIDLQLADTPSYEWYVVGGTAPGNPVESGPYALWNKATGDYLVEGSQTWSIGLNWYQKTISSQGGSGSGSSTTNTSGVRSLTVYNCADDGDAVQMWVQDVTAGTGWQDKGELASQWDDDGDCPATGSPWVFVPVSGHSYVVESVDFIADGCSNEPDISCELSTTTFTGNSNGSPASVTVS